MNAIPPIHLNEYALALLAPMLKQKQYWRSNSTPKDRQEPEGTKDYENEHEVVEQIEPVPEPLQESHLRVDPIKGRGYGHTRPPRYSRDHIRTLAKAAKYSNDVLVQNHADYRIEVIEEDDRVFLEVVTLDKEGNETGRQRRDITNEDFDRWVNDVRDRAGLLFDSNPRWLRSTGRR